MPTANKLFLFLLLLHKITVVNGSYVEVVTGTCASVANRGALADMVACEAGKTALGLNTGMPGMGSSETVNSANEPQGCSTDGWQLTFNTDTTSTKTCRNYQKCICFTATACDSTDGTVVNSDPCICNTVACPNSNSLCNYGASECSFESCSNTDTSAANTDMCTCGTSTCGASNGMYCNLATNTCSGGATCSVVDGSIANSVDCTCGTAACNSVNGMFCISNRNLCGNLPACPTIYTADATEVAGADGWNVWSASCVLASDYVVGQRYGSSVVVVKLKKDPSMTGELVIDRRGDVNKGRHFVVYDTFEIEGLTLTGGTGECSENHCSTGNSEGGAVVVVREATSAKFTDCKFRGNTATEHGSSYVSIYNLNTS